MICVDVKDTLGKAYSLKLTNYSLSYFPGRGLCEETNAQYN